MVDNTFRSEVFASHLQEIELAGERETILYAPRPILHEVGEAFADVNQIAVIGWNSQGPAQARNLRDSLTEIGSDTRVVVGLRWQSEEHRADAESHGFTRENDTLLTPEEALGGSAMSLMLISDAGMAKDGHEYLGLMPEGATLGLSHGFWLGYLEARGERPRPGIDIVGVCPKGMGPSVRRLYEQGSGINSSFAAPQYDPSLGKGNPQAIERALAWSVAIGSPYSFQTTLENEWRSDVFGERSILLGGVHGILEATYQWKLEHRVDAEGAYLQTVESLVGPISHHISHDGLDGLFDKLDAGEREKFAVAYDAAYPVLKELISKIYTDVSSGREIEEVVSDGVQNTPMTQVDGTPMWRVGELVRASKGSRTEIADIDPTVAGIYLAGMIAQVDVLREHGHNWSEVVNESIIEAVDSLNPYMQARGVAYMVDNCSVTARRGSRKWAPLFQAWIAQGVLPVIDGTKVPENAQSYINDFLRHPVHKVLLELSKLRPDADIAVS